MGVFYAIQALEGAMTNEALDSVEGRPTKYKDEYAKQAYKLCLLGSTDEDMAGFFEVSKSTINNWKHEYPEFLDSIKRGKISADANVASRLYKRAIGYEHDEDKIFNNNGAPLIVPTIKHVQPDTTAAIFWLKNRQPARWRDKQEVDVTISPLNELLQQISGNTIEPKDD